MKRLFTALVALGVVVALAVPAKGGQGPVFLESSKQTQGGFSDFTRLRIPVGESKLGYVRATNTLDGRRTAFLTATNFTDNFRDYPIRYYDAAAPQPSKDITDEVLEDTPARGGNEGFRFSLAPGQSKLFTVRIKHASGTPPLCLRTELRTGQTGDFTFFEVNGRNNCVQ